MRCAFSRTAKGYESAVARILQRCAGLEDASATEARALAHSGGRELRLVEAWLGTLPT